MDTNRINTGISHNRDTALLFPLAIIAAIILIGGLSLIYLTDDKSNPFSEMYLMPWVLLLGVTIAIPNIYLIYKGKFHLFHPVRFLRPCREVRK